LVAPQLHADYIFAAVGPETRIVEQAHQGLGKTRLSGCYRHGRGQIGRYLTGKSRAGQHRHVDILPDFLCHDLMQQSLRVRFQPLGGPGNAGSRGQVGAYPDE